VCSVERAEHVIRERLLDDLGLVRRTTDNESAIDIDDLDFYTGRKCLDEVLKREDDQCFYCLRRIETAELCRLHRVVPQVKGCDHLYRNVVASCHHCNSRKQGKDATDFLRDLYRRSVISQDELEVRSAALRELKEGRLRPAVAG